jgi:uroporphyrinogen decarboxylase
LATEKLTPRARMEACLGDTHLDRVPVALWRHFPVDDQYPENLAAATINFQRNFDFDFVKVTPASSFCVKDWGVQDVWQGSSEGTRNYHTYAIHKPEDWLKLAQLDVRQGYLGAQLNCLKLIVNELGPQIPTIQTVFNPLSQAKNLVSRDSLLVHLRRYPEAVEAGLNIISEVTYQFVRELKSIGVAGIFYAVQHAQFGLLSEKEYLHFGKQFDLKVLEAAQELWLNVLHLHGEDVMFDLFTDYPVQVINWHDQDTPPSLTKALKKFPGVVCGGLRREKTMVLGIPADVNNEARQAIRETGGKRFILGTGCVVPIIAPYGNLLAARQSVEK